MSRVFVCGAGAVSPAGWGLEPLRNALDARVPLPVSGIERPGWTKPLRARLVPAPASRPAFLAHPRLRRSSPITHYAAAAALEALAGFRAKVGASARLGLIVCLQSGCVQYTYRFFGEALENPATASPLLFPETVFAAPASHVAALLENVPMASTLIGDPAIFGHALAQAAEWLAHDEVDACLVVGAEEVNWLRADALWHLEHAAIITCGAGALCLTLDEAASAGVELAAVTEARAYTARQPRVEAARRMRADLEGAGLRTTDLLCDGLGDSCRADAPEKAAWLEWPGARSSPKLVLGEGLMASSAWQCVAAFDAVARGGYHAAAASLVGCNQEAVGVRFKRTNA
jgi:hypothetical protein